MPLGFAPFPPSSIPTRALGSVFWPESLEVVELDIARGRVPIRSVPGSTLSACCFFVCAAARRAPA